MVGCVESADWGTDVDVAGVRGSETGTRDGSV